MKHATFLFHVSELRLDQADALINVYSPSFYPAHRYRRIWGAVVGGLFVAPLIDSTFGNSN